MRIFGIMTYEHSFVEESNCVRIKLDVEDYHYSSKVNHKKSDAKEFVRFVRYTGKLMVMGQTETQKELCYRNMEYCFLHIHPIETMSMILVARCCDHHDERLGFFALKQLFAETQNANSWKLSSMRPLRHIERIILQKLNHCPKKILVKHKNNSGTHESQRKSSLLSSASFLTPSSFFSKKSKP